MKNSLSEITKIMKGLYLGDMNNDNDWYDRCIECGDFITIEESRGCDYPLYCREHKYLNNYNRFEMIDWEEQIDEERDSTWQAYLHWHALYEAELEKFRFEIMDFDDE